MNRTYFPFESRIFPLSYAKKHYFYTPIFYRRFPTGEVAERLIVAVSKTVEGNTSGGSNPPLSATALVKKHQKPANSAFAGFFVFAH
jgi:hypothetical protein